MMEISSSSLERLFLTTPKSQWSRIWKRVQTVEGARTAIKANREASNFGGDVDAVPVFLEGKRRTFESFMGTREEKERFKFVDAPSDEEDVPTHDIIAAVVDNQPKPMLEDASPLVETVPLNIDVPEMTIQEQDNWLDFIRTTLYVCSMKEHNDETVIEVGSHLMRWLRIMTTKLELFEDEYPFCFEKAMEKSAIVGKLGEFRKTKKKKKGAVVGTVAENIFASDRFERRVEWIAKKTSELGPDDYTVYTTKRTHLGKYGSLLKQLLGIPNKVLNMYSSFIQDRVWSIVERPHIFNDSITTYEKNDDDMCERHFLMHPPEYPRIEGSCYMKKRKRPGVGKKGAKRPRGSKFPEIDLPFDEAGSAEIWKNSPEFAPWGNEASSSSQQPR